MLIIRKLSSYSSVVLFVMFTILCGFTVPNLPGDEDYAPFAEQMPEPIGGPSAIYKKIVYPDIAKNAGLEGKVYVLIFVSENGSVDDVKVIKDIGGGCGDAAIKAIKQTKYKPGQNGGANIKVKLSMAIPFQLHAK